MLMTSPNGRLRLTAKLAALASVPLLMMSLAACSGESDSAEESAGTKQTLADWQLKFAACMRDEGVDYPDPDENGSMSINAESAGSDEFLAAQKTCSEELGDPPISSGGEFNEEEFLEEQLEIAECFRENGFDVPDPKPQEGFKLPDDMPEEVLAECIPASSSGGGGGGGGQIVPAG